MSTKYVDVVEYKLDMVQEDPIRVKNHEESYLYLSLIITQDNYTFQVVIDEDKINPSNGQKLKEEFIDLEFKIEELDLTEFENQEDRFIVEFNIIENDL